MGCSNLPVPSRPDRDCQRVWRFKMETSKLIKAMVADTVGRRIPLQRVWSLSALVAVSVAAVVFFVLLGVRADFDEALQSFRFLFKFLVTITLAASDFAVVRALSRPAKSLEGIAPWLLTAPVLLCAGILFELLAVPSAQWTSRLVGTNSMVCLTYIPVIGAVPLAIFLFTLSYGAPTRPGLSGVLAGVLAGGISATFYAAQCTDDSPLFVATWYTIAISALAIVGALVGTRMLRW